MRLRAVVLAFADASYESFDCVFIFRLRGCERDEHGKCVWCCSRGDVLECVLPLVQAGLFCRTCCFEFSVLFGRNDINLVDPASSHTLVSKIKPCMSKYKHFYTVKLRMAHYISYSLLDSTLLLGYP